MLLQTVLFFNLIAFAQSLVFDGPQSGSLDLRQFHQLLIEERLARIKSEIQLNDRILELESERMHCGSTCEKIPTIAFMAQLSSNVVDPSNGNAVIFDQVETNTGGAYNGSQGVFMAPLNGTYNFNLVVSSPPKSTSNWMHLFMMRNDVEVDYVFLDANDRYYLRRSTGICIIDLTRGDKIWVKVDEVSINNTITGCCFHTQFSGFLIGTN